LEERLHKVLAQHGMGSRRQVEEWIRAGRILVNGRPATIGQRIRTSDRIVLDGRDVTQRVGAAQRLRIVVYHKPGGELQRGRAGDDRSTVDARLPSLHSGRWLPINTLGFAEDGLLLLTNDGALAAAAGRRGRDLPVEYRVRVLRPRDGADWPSIPRAIDADGQRVEFAAVDRIDAPGSNVWFRLECARAVPRGAVRALFDAAGLKVSRVLLTRWGQSVCHAICRVAGRASSPGRSSRCCWNWLAAINPRVVRAHPAARESGGRRVVETAPGDPT
jgi:23S rRNA pseudouridine2605 synthase